MLSLKGLTKSFMGERAVSDVSFDAGEAEIVGLGGQSGSGKSTIARCILGLERPDQGAIAWQGRPLADRVARRIARREIQTVFQDPRSSLNPRWTVRRVPSEPLDNWSGWVAGEDRSARLEALLRRVSLSPELLARYPHELSTGQ
ncbi:MAG: ATP-binding cassette domain-containing protein [Pseudomonadota bacterium]